MRVAMIKNVVLEKYHNAQYKDITSFDNKEKSNPA